MTFLKQIFGKKLKKTLIRIVMPFRPEFVLRKICRKTGSFILRYLLAWLTVSLASNLACFGSTQLWTHPAFPSFGWFFQRYWEHFGMIASTFSGNLEVPLTSLAYLYPDFYLYPDLSLWRLSSRRVGIGALTCWHDFGVRIKILYKIKFN